MEQIITNIFQTLEDYRQDENRPNVRITRDRIREWVNQFNENQRIPILTELDNIFRKRYCSKDKVKDFLRQVIEVLKNDFGFTTPQAFLKNSDFLNVQPAGKSQDKMLKLFDELIQERYNLSLNDCGTESKKYTVYIDDILCTGLTLISDIKEWAELEYSTGKKNKDAVADDSTTLVFAYVFIHNKNYRKKVAEMRHKISQEVSSKHKMYRLFDIENKAEVNSKIDIILPLEDGQPEEVIEYQEAIAERVNQRAEERGWNQGPDEFYRPPGCPRTEDFFTSPDNRKLVENAFLTKGIEILNRANSQIPNIRALGYSLPSLKDFGFGALCFTWRNVPNNAPLVFWYSGGGFTPLFKVKRGTGDFFFNITSTLKEFYDNFDNDWKEIVKWNCIGFDTEIARNKVSDENYKPNNEELQRIEELEEIWINWWENDPPSEDFGIESIKPITKFHNLKSIVIRSLNLKDLTPLSSLPKLNSLICQFSKVKNIASLSNLTELVHLDLRYNSIEDISALEKLTNLQSLDLSSTDVCDIRPLTNMINLKNLSLSFTNVTDLSPLKNLMFIEELWLGSTKVKSILPLFDLNLKQLILNDDEVEDDEVINFVETHPDCRVFFRGKAYNEKRNEIDLSF